MAREQNLTKIYNHRFRRHESSRSITSRANAWVGLYETVLKKYITSNMSIVDLGSGPGHFINQVKAQSLFAVDLDSNNSSFIRKDINFVCTKAQNLNFAKNNSVDLVFSSNLFEHLGSIEILLDTLNEVHRILKDENSKLIILMPNIRYVKWDFYNFIDHNLPLNEQSLSEALELCNFDVKIMHKRFFPYSANGIQLSIPVSIVKIYLLLSPRVRPFAKQMFVVAQPKVNT